MKILLALPILVSSVVASTFEMYESREAKQAVEGGGSPWPAIFFPKNFKLEGAYYTFDSTTNELVPYYGVTVAQFIDSTGNREKIITNQYVGGYIGYANVTNFIDCTAGLITQHIQAMNYCTQLPFSTYNLTEIIANATNPASG